MGDQIAQSYEVVNAQGGWGDFLNNIAQDYVGSIYQRETAQPATVSVNPATGAQMREGKPAGAGGIPTMVWVVGGVAVAGLVAFMLLRK